jgi:hypothetical protein
VLQFPVFSSVSVCPVLATATSSACFTQDVNVALDYWLKAWNAALESMDDVIKEGNRAEREKCEE